MRVPEAYCWEQLDQRTYATLCEEGRPEGGRRALAGYRLVINGSGMDDRETEAAVRVSQDPSRIAGPSASPSDVGARWSLL